MLIFFILVFIVSTGFFLKEIFIRSKEEDKFEVLQEHIEQITQADDDTYDTADTSNEMMKKYALLYEQNNDMIGWVKIEDTHINYPVMQTKNDEQFYLRRNFDKEYSIAGTPFLAASSDVDRENSQTIIFGHHMNNNTMFSDLLLYKKDNFFNENTIISFDTLNEERQYEIFTAFKIDSAENNGHFPFYTYTGFNSKETLDEFLTEVSAISVRPIENPPVFGDSILTLVTCDTNDSTNRFVVMAKLIKE